MQAKRIIDLYGCAFCANGSLGIGGSASVSRGERRLLLGSHIAVYSLAGKMGALLEAGYVG